MPQIPIIQGPALRENALQTAQLSTPDVSSGLRSLANGLGAASSVAEKAVQRQDTDLALSTDAQVKTEFMKFDADLRQKSQGRDATGYAEKVNAWWMDKSKAVGENLTANQKGMIGASLRTAQVHSTHAAQKFQDGELERSEMDSFNAAQLAEIQRAAASGDPAVAATSADLLNTRNAQMAQQKGWTPEVLAQANTKATTALHVNLIQDIQQKDPVAALAYFNSNKTEIDGTRHAEITRGLDHLAAGAEGAQAAADIWKEMGPKGYNQPVDRAAMEDAARKKYANDLPRQKAAIDAIKEQAAAFNSSETEANAGNVNAVMATYAKGGMSMQQLQRLPAFQALPGKEQAQITDRVDNRINTLVTRGAASEQRADAAESRAQRKLERNGMAAYLQLSDPAVLANMTDAQVQAQLPVLGNDLTKHLVEKKRSVQKPGGEAEAKMDQDDFYHAAERMGMKPYEKKNDTEKAALGETKYRVEQLIYQAQQVKKAPLTRAEKAELMTQELARTVKIDGGWFSSDKDKPVMQLNKDDIKDVIIPPKERTQLTAVMQQQYAATKNSLFAPTDANLRRFYLLSKSRSAALLPPSD